MTYPVRAKPPPKSVQEAAAIASQLVGDIRLRLEEHEAIAMLVCALHEQLKPSTAEVGQ